MPCSTGKPNVLAAGQIMLTCDVLGGKKSLNYKIDGFISGPLSDHALTLCCLVPSVLRWV